MSIFDDIGTVEAEYRAATVAVSRLGDQASRDPTVLRRTGVQPGDLRGCGRNLERTYILRLYAEFEGELRRYWRHIRHRPHLQRTPAEVRIPPNCLGEHNEYVYGELLGMPREEIEQLKEEKYIGDAFLPEIP